ncbi:MAG: Oligoendopeptidase F, plasmid [Chlamydiales bacterium]|nr:Oligoendopeptidase F, plasmid [Chlamydiales bacterium]
MSTATELLKKRSELPSEDQWNVEALYPFFENWEKDLKAICEQASPPRWPGLANFRGRLSENASVVKEVFDRSCAISRELEKLHTYAHLRHDEEMTHDTHKSAYQQIMALLFDFQQESAWIEPELLALPADVVDRYLKAPELAEYRFHIEKIVRMRPHTLSADKEELLAMAGKPMQTPPKAFSALNNADLQFGAIQDSNGQEHPLSHGLYQTYLRSPDRVLRENAFKGMHGTFQGFENTLAELLQGEIQSHVFQAKARHYPSCLEAALFPKKIPQSVYRTLIAAIRDGLPVLHRYVGLRKKVLNLPELHLYDMYAPLVREVDIKMNYQEAEEVIIESVAPLGSQYQESLKKGLKQERWVDRYENKNKRSGAYSSGCYDSFPYILMNFRGILRDTFTLAHEAGHSMHSHLSKTHQPYHYSHYPIFVAEVASTFNEELLMQLLLKQFTKKEERLFLVNEKLEDIRATLFRQAMFAEFELTIHELVEAATPLTPALLKELYYQLNIDYFGPDAVIDPEIQIEWARIPHFYYNFYVYQYATGISAAFSLLENVLSGDATAKDNYLAFLQGGCSLFPIDLLKLAGVDMTTQAPVQAAIRKFDSLLTEFESLLV